MQEDILGKLGPEFEEVWKDVNQRYVFFDEKDAELGKHIVQFMVGIMESLSSLGATAMPSHDVTMNAIGTTSIHGHSGHSTRDGFLAVQSPRKDLSILVIGKAGTGKSSLANAILRKPEFEVAVGMTIKTNTAVKGSVCLGDRNVKVVDTPDITNLSGEISKQDEIRKWIDLTSPSPDVIVLAIRCDSKYTPEDFAMYQELQRLGLKSVLEQKLLVVFTFGDQRQPDFEGDIRRAGSNLHAVMKDAGKRRLIYNDKWTSEKAAFVIELLHMVSSIQTQSRHL
ncbi:GTPase IMAP family member 6-like [Littorina saxatilis]|uniref:GTPase IMAP family member 6-like n=1 Tax=Littorina saxatilis TaxID=31220 RepID=UPI0038B6AAB0